MTKRSLSLLLCLAIIHPTTSVAQDRSARSRIELQRVTTFGELEGDRSVTFGLIQDLVATDSTVAVLDRRFQELRLFDLRGDHLKTFGRPGRGPGEFFVPQALARTGNEVFVLDPANARITRYRIHHESPALLESFPIDLSPSDLCVSGSALYLSAYRDERLVHKYSLEGRPLASFGAPAGTRQGPLTPSPANSFLVCVPDLDLIVVKPVLGPELLAYNSAGELQWSATIPDFTMVQSKQNLDGSITFTAPSPAGHDIVSSALFLPPNLVVVQVGLSNRETGSKEELIQLRSYVFAAETGALLFQQESLPRLKFADRHHLYSVVNQPYPAVAIYQYTLR